eukprot:GDKI01017545.1.p1 GENE.GDKI01017545.1~~GDKI01017545.1.p1  ORF type:complete len:162 (-),score=34.39 GDKI01017545.1:205-690(-)
MEEKKQIRCGKAVEIKQKGGKWRVFLTVVCSCIVSLLVNHHPTDDYFSKGGDMSMRKNVDVNSSIAVPTPIFPFDMCMNEYFMVQYAQKNTTMDVCLLPHTANPHTTQQQHQYESNTHTHIQSSVITPHTLFSTVWLFCFTFLAGAVANSRTFRALAVLLV